MVPLRVLLVAVAVGVLAQPNTAVQNATNPCPHPELTVLLMTYNRVASANGVVWQLRRMLGRSTDARAIRLVVSQNHQRGENYTAALAALLDAEHSGVFCSVEHVLTPMLRGESTSSFGSKRNAQNNLLQGLRAVFKRNVGAAAGDDNVSESRRRLSSTRHAAAPASDGSPAFTIVLEDDILLSADALEYFRYAGKAVVCFLRATNCCARAAASAPLRCAGSVMAGRSGVYFATARALWRPSILVGGDDIGLIRSMRAAVSWHSLSSRGL